MNKTKYQSRIEKAEEIRKSSASGKPRTKQCEWRAAIYANIPSEFWTTFFT